MFTRSSDTSNGHAGRRACVGGASKDRRSTYTNDIRSRPTGSNRASALVGNRTPADRIAVAATNIASLRMFPPLGIVERVVGYSAQHINRNSPDEFWNGVDDSKWLPLSRLNRTQRFRFLTLGVSIAISMQLVSAAASPYIVRSDIVLALLFFMPKGSMRRAACRQIII
jgi:hypothetical protein